MTLDGSSPLVWPLVLALALGAFLVPGLLGAAALARRSVVPATAVLLTAVALSSALGYATFWVYLADEQAGRVVSIAVTAAGIVVPLAWAPARRMVRRAVGSREVGVPLALLILVALLYSGLLSAHGQATPPTERANVHLLGGNGLPVDNRIPLLFADRLYRGEDPRALVGDWTSSDRPPLQTGAVLLQRPLASALGLTELHYQLLSSLLQCSWVAAVWALAAQARFRPPAAALAMAVATFSGFFFLNSVYVWPKLYAAALALLAYVLLVGRRPTWPAAALAALGVGLGLLAHAGVVFTLVPLAALVVARRTRPGLVPAAAGAVVVAVLLGPWWAYARFYDPPGNRLAKWHLAGVVPIDDRSLTRTLADSYSAAGPSVLVDNKVENLAYVGRPLPRWSQIRAGGVEGLRQREFAVVTWSLAGLNLAWIALAAGLARARRSWAVPEWRGSLGMLALAAAAVVVWSLMMFGPATTLIHQGSYATMILLWVGLAGVVGTGPRWWSAAVAAVQVAWFAVVWATDLPGPDAPIRVADAIVAALAALLTLAVLGRVAAAPPAPDEHERAGPPEDEPAPDLALVGGATG